MNAGLRSLPNKKATRKRYEKRAQELADASRETERLYAAAIESGEISPPAPRSRRAALERAAEGHPDNESTKAAKRLLAKRQGNPRDPRIVIGKFPKMKGGDTDDGADITVDGKVVGQLTRELEYKDIGTISARYRNIVTGYVVTLWHLGEEDPPPFKELAAAKKYIDENAIPKAPA